MYSVKTQLSISNVRVLQKLSPNTKRSIRQLEKTHRLSFNIFLCSFYRFLSLSLSLFKNSFYFIFLVLSSFVIFSCFFFYIFFRSVVSLPSRADIRGASKSVFLSGH